jgi:hypothetical protein
MPQETKGITFAFYRLAEQLTKILHVAPNNKYLIADRASLKRIWPEQHPVWIQVKDSVKINVLISSLPGVYLSEKEITGGEIKAIMGHILWVQEKNTPYQFSTPLVPLIQVLDGAGELANYDKDKDYPFHTLVLEAAQSVSLKNPSIWIDLSLHKKLEKAGIYLTFDIFRANTVWGIPVYFTVGLDDKAWLKVDGEAAGEAQFVEIPLAGKYRRGETKNWYATQPPFGAKLEDWTFRIGDLEDYEDYECYRYERTDE